jgi:hypothetical protein
MGRLEEPAQNGRGVKRAAQRSGEFLCCLAARSRALCALDCPFVGLDVAVLVGFGFDRSATASEFNELLGSFDCSDGFSVGQMVTALANRSYRVSRLAAI